MTSWDEIAEKEGRIYCQVHDTWCAFINMNNGTCSATNCIHKADMQRKDKDE